MNKYDLFSLLEYIDEETLENSEEVINVKIKRKDAGRITKRAVVLVAVFVLIAVMATAAFAIRIFSLNDTVLSDDSEDTITLAGYVGSDEFKASAEWQEFMNSYDLDGTVLNQNDKNTQYDEKYSCYGVYSQEMADKVDEIASKYNLSLMKGYEEMLSGEMSEKIGNFIIGENNTPYSGYKYDNGTFRFDGFFTASSGMLTDYQFSRSAKNSFDPVVLNIGDADAYTQINYTVDGGYSVLIALSDFKAVVLTENENFFICINVLGGSASGLAFSDLEELVDSFDYSVLAK